MTTNFLIKGTHCPACKMVLEESISELPGVHSVVINFENGETVLDHDNDFNWGALRMVVEGEGNYRVELPQVAD